MTTQEMLAAVRWQLAIDLNCEPADFLREKDSFVFVEAKDNPGRRPFRRGEQFFEMLTMGQSIVVSATPARLAFAREQLAGRQRDDAFALPFIRGHVLCYLPDLENLRLIEQPRGFEYTWVPQSGVSALCGLPGFLNAVQHDAGHPVQNVLALTATQGGGTAAIAGAFGWSACMWSIGIDVLPEYRGQGLAAYLVNTLTHEMLRQNIVPVYSTASSNIASQRVGYRAGFRPAWMSDRQLQFEGELRN